MACPPKSATRGSPVGAAANSAALEAADAVAERILALAVPLRVAVAITDGDVNATYRLRFEVASEMGWISDPADPDGFEKDSYDDGAIHIGAWDGALLGGTQRIILPAPGRLLPEGRPVRPLDRSTHWIHTSSYHYSDTAPEYPGAGRERERGRPCMPPLSM